MTAKIYSLPEEPPPTYEVRELMTLEDKEVVAMPCDCSGDCKNGVPAEYCPSWLAHTFEMTLQRCEVSKDQVWHRNGVCHGCHPLFPPGMTFRRA